MVDATVLIVGCGPTGLIVAHELLRRGMSCRLGDKRPAPQSSTRAFTVYARTMEMFDHMGMAYRVDEVRAVCPGNLFHLSEFCARGVPLQWGGQDGFGAADLYVDYVGSINDSRRTVRTCATALADIAAGSKRIEMADDFTSIACFVKMERL